MLAQSSLPGVYIHTPAITGRFPISQSESCDAVAVLYARKNSVYKKIAGCDVFDQARDARTFSGRFPVIAHPPCRLWGRLYKFSTAPVSEKLLALDAVHAVRTNGGVLEHPAWSKLWPAAGLPLPGARDEFGGFTLPILQSWFGHKAPKATWLYIVGIEPALLPVFPFALGIPTGRVCATGSMKLREGTPLDLAHWLVALARQCKPKSVAFRPASAMSLPSRMPQIASCDVLKSQKSFFDLADVVSSVQEVFESGYYVIPGLSPTDGTN